MVRKSVFVLVLAVVLCSVLSVPALAGTDEAGVFQGRIEDFIETPAFQAQSVISRDDLKGLPTGNAISPVYVSPAKWSKGWLDGDVGSWLKCHVVWKTANGVDSYFFEISYIDGSYQLVKEDLMSEHEKSVNRY